MKRNFGINNNSKSKTTSEANYDLDLSNLQRPRTYTTSKYMSCTKGDNHSVYTTIYTPTYTWYLSNEHLCVDSPRTDT